jgi:hypothetical protein
MTGTKKASKTEEEEQLQRRAMSTNCARNPPQHRQWHRQRQRRKTSKKEFDLCVDMANPTLTSPNLGTESEEISTPSTAAIIQQGLTALPDEHSRN